MIKVTVQYQHQRIHALTMSGHAGAGDVGYDLVCAGASAIIFGALNALDMLAPEQCQLNVEKNRIHIEVIKESDPLNLLLESLLIQLKTLETSYNQYINIKTEVL